MGGLKHFSSLTIVAGASILLLTLMYSSNWKNNDSIVFDTAGYYSYLPAVFIYDDLTFSFYDSLRPTYGEKIIRLTETPEGSRLQKYSIGASLFYFPLFLTAHAFAILSEYPADGYSLPYQVSLQFTGLIYVIWGLIVLRTLLLRYFSDKIAGGTIIAILFGTNLFYYAAVEPTMTHAISFLLFAYFAEYSVKWLTSKRLNDAVITAVVSSLILLVRPVNALLFVIPFLYGISSMKMLAGRCQFFIENWRQLLLMLLIGGLLLLPQLIYWKVSTDSFIFYSYVGEQFFFDQPHIIDGLFSYRKGWLIYTPIMVFALAGIFLMKGAVKNWRLPVITFIGVYVYVIFSWWCWWYGGGFGSRVMVETYAILAIPFGSFLNFLKSKNAPFKITTWVILVALIGLNLFQTYQKKEGLIHYAGMTKEAYWKVFGKTSYPYEYWESIKMPDDVSAKKGQPEKLSKLIEDSTIVGSMVTDNDENTLEVYNQARPYSKSVKINAELLSGYSSELIEVRVTSWVKPLGANHDAWLVAQFQNSNDTPFDYHSKQFRGTVDEGWKKLRMNFPIPRELKQETSLIVFLNSPGKDGVKIKDLKVEVLEITKY